VTESLALAAIGGAAGLVVASWSLGWIRALGGSSVPRLDEIAIDPVVLAFTLGASVLAGLLFGLAPAWRLAQVDLQADLKSATRGSPGEGGWRRSGGLRRLLVTTEVALAVVLLLSAPAC
jgi:hypothetical protein